MGAQCGSAARWDLCGGRPQPATAKGRPYRDRACPPEDCGGPPGYERLLSALLNDDDDELVAWVGGFFDPEGFDVNRTNQALRNGPLMPQV